MNKRAVVSISLLLVLWSGAPSLAQTDTAQVTGRITDPSGAVVPGAQVRISNVATGIDRKTITNSDGYYTIPFLAAGSYRMEVVKEGFQPMSRSGMTLNVGQTARLDVELQLGSTTSSVAVTADLPLLQSETSAVAATVRNETIVNMPLIERRAAQLVRLTGNVVQTSGSGDEFSIAGGRGANTMWYMDGSTVQNNSLGIPTLQYNPPVASLQEFNVSVSTYSAQ